MAYYKFKFYVDCDEHNCTSVAKYEVRGHRNESYGRFCTRHANAKVKILQGNGETK